MILKSYRYGFRGKISRIYRISFGSRFLLAMKAFELLACDTCIAGYVCNVEGLQGMARCSYLYYSLGSGRGMAPGKLFRV